MQKWEYKIERVDGTKYYREDTLNYEGDEGWELVTIYREDGSYYAVFKRPKQ